MLPSVDAVRRVARGYADRPSRHRVAHTDDYLTDPRASGYRGIHLVSRFHPGEEEAVYAGLRIEIQLRSRLQHAWAAAVRDRGHILRSGASSPAKGTEAGLRLFALMASEIAFSEECPLVPDTADSRDLLRRELAAAAAALDAVCAIGEIPPGPEGPGGSRAQRPGGVLPPRRGVLARRNRPRPLERVRKGRARGGHSRLRGGRSGPSTTSRAPRRCSSGSPRWTPCAALTQATSRIRGHSSPSSKRRSLEQHAGYYPEPRPPPWGYPASPGASIHEGLREPFPRRRGVGGAGLESAPEQGAGRLGSGPQSPSRR